ncbi:MAG: zinc-ribbon domain-containing protein [Thomasclavelia sp.]|nr:zinc-ribbon domain-containing protein [Thomasclavelia sp.]
MKCEKCGREIADDMRFCPECGTPVPVKSYCPKCGNEIKPGDQFCEKCGTYVGGQQNFQNQNPTPNQNQNYNQQPYNNYGNYSNSYNQYGSNPYGSNQYGSNQYGNNQYGPNPYGPVNSYNNQNMYQPPIKKVDPKLNHEAIKNDKYKGYWRKPIIWIISGCILALSFFAYSFMASNPITHENATLNITSSETTQAVQSNINNSGLSFIKGNSIYYVTNATLYKADNIDKGFNGEGVTKLAKNVTGYLYADDNYVYYTDSSNNYIQQDLKTKSINTILKDVFYVQRIDNKIYYQLDSDDESLHVYDLDSKEDKALNKEHTYQTYIDKDNSKIYYIKGNTETEKDDLCVINTDGSEHKVLVSNVKATALFVNENKLYFANSKGVCTLDTTNLTENMESTVVTKEENIYSINQYKDGYVFSSASNFGVQYKSYDNKDKDTFFSSEYVSSVEVLGDALYINTATSDSTGNLYFVKGSKYCEVGSNETSSYSYDEDE